MKDDPNYHRQLNNFIFFLEKTKQTKHQHNETARFARELQKEGRLAMELTSNPLNLNFRNQKKTPTHQVNQIQTLHCLECKYGK